MKEDQTTIHNEYNTIQQNSTNKRDSSTIKAENPGNVGLNPVKSLTLTDKLVTGIIAVALMCIAPIIPILIAFGVGHFVRYNADKLKRENNYERRYTRRH